MRKKLGHSYAASNLNEQQHELILFQENIQEIMLIHLIVVYSTHDKSEFDSDLRTNH